MRKTRDLFRTLGLLTTERRNPRSRDIDSLDTREILSLINREDARVAPAVRRELRSIGKAVGIIVRQLKRGGRLIYVGAGTSGRLGVLDAAECPPTYGTPRAMIQAVIAGGKESVFASREGAEDRAAEGARAMQKLAIGARDAVCGIAASLRTPFVVSAIKEAKARGARTIYVTTNPQKVLKLPLFRELRGNIDSAICVDVGPEVVTGSTRMKAGTAQKMVLNMLTTATMIRLGKVYENMMIDLKMNSRKLEERAKRVLMTVTGVDYATAEAKLRQAGGHVKTAIVMVSANIGAADARRRLEEANGFVRLALNGKSDGRREKRRK